MGVRGVPLSPERRAKIAAVLKGNTNGAGKRSVAVRVRMSLRSMMEDRVERIRKSLRDDPALAARTQASRRQGIAKAQAAQRQERAQRANAPILGAISPGMVGAWEAGRDLTTFQPPRFE